MTSRMLISLAPISIFLATGCAVMQKLPGAPALEERDAAPFSPPVVELRSLEEVQRDLPSLRSEKVTLPTSVLRSLVQSERELNWQLKMLKDVDYELHSDNRR